MNRIDATPTSAPDRGCRLGAGRGADAEGHRFAWHPAPHTEEKNLRVTDEKVRPDAGIHF